MSAAPWLFTDDLRLSMLLPRRPEEHHIRRVAGDLGRARAEVRRRRRVLRRGARRRDGTAGLPGKVTNAHA